MDLFETSDGYLEIRPRPSPEDLKRFYNDRYFGSGDGRNNFSHRYTDEELEHKLLAAAEAERIVGKSTGTLFEVGVGEGFFLSYFIRKGWAGRGIDFTDAGLMAFFPEHRQALTLGDAFDLLEEETAGGRRYDLVACNNVLEHVIDPERLLTNLHRITAPDGLCRIAVPNDGSWLQHEAVRRGLAEDRFWVCPPEHLSYFTPPTLSRLLDRCGWTVVEMLGEFPVDLFLLNPDSCYTRDPSRGRNCHFSRVAFEMGLWRQSLDALLAFRRGCAQAGVGRNLVAYVRAKE